LSGIVGIWALDGRPIESDSIEKMIAAVRYRGPDGSGSWSDGTVWLGNVQLCTTPESLHERQPLLSADGQVCLTADVRLDNRQDLQAAFATHGICLRTDTDAELILAAYELWGEDCPTHLIGDFAFAIWDKRRKQLFCVRDPIGAKPFYYHHSETRFVFASTPTALFAEGTIARRPNLKQLFLALLDEKLEIEETYAEGIARLPPAYRLILKEGQLRKSLYWDVTAVRSLHYRSDEEYAEHFLEIFREAVRARLRSQTPVGATLSGGLDSSSVVCMAHKVLQDGAIPGLRLETFSQLYEGYPCDERIYIDEVIRSKGLPAHFLRYEQCCTWADFERAESMPDVTYQPVLFLCASNLEAARSLGMRSMLFGHGADELLSHGYAHLTELWRAGRLYRLSSQLRSDARDFQCSAAALFAQHCLRASVPKAIKKIIRPLVLPGSGRAIRSWINKSTLEKSGVLEVLRQRATRLRFTSTAREMVYNRFLDGWNVHNVYPLVEHLGAYFGIESRYPFMDRRLIEFLVGVPWEQRWQGGLTKAILRRALVGILPEKIRKRSDKAFLTSIIENEFKGRQAEKADRLLGSSALGDFGLVYPAELQSAFQASRAASGAGFADWKVWDSVFRLELWCRFGLGNKQLEALHARG
jgi:asparagine synthase (glutamine-hydrolysing)